MSGVQASPQPSLVPLALSSNLSRGLIFHLSEPRARAHNMCLPFSPSPHGVLPPRNVPFPSRPIPGHRFQPDHLPPSCLIPCGSFFTALLIILGSFSTSLQRFSVRIIPPVNVFLMSFWGWVPCPFTSPSWFESHLFNIFLTLNFVVCTYSKNFLCYITYPLILLGIFVFAIWFKVFIQTYMLPFLLLFLEGFISFGRPPPYSHINIHCIYFNAFCYFVIKIITL